MSDKSRPKPPDPLDEPLELLEDGDSDEEDVVEEEPEPSTIDPLPTLHEPNNEDAAAIAPPEPAPTLLDDVALTGSLEAFEQEDEATPEPPGDDLSWAEEEEGGEPADGAPLPEETPEDDPHEPWIEEREDEGISESEWQALEDERLLVVGYEEEANLPELGLFDVPVKLSTTQAASSLMMPTDALPSDQAAVVVEVQMGRLSLKVHLRLQGGSSETTVVLGRDALSGRVMVDPGRRLLLGK